MRRAQHRHAAHRQHRHGGGDRLERVAEPQRHQQRHRGADVLGGGVQRARSRPPPPTTSTMPARCCVRAGRWRRCSLDAVGQHFPDRRQLAGQEGQLAQVGVAFAGAVEIAAARGRQAELARGLGVLSRTRPRVWLPVTTSTPWPPWALNSVNSANSSLAVKLVARRMRDHGHAAGAGDPLHGVPQRRPAVRHVARACLRSGSLRNTSLVSLQTPALHQEAGEVRARDQLGVADVLQRAFVGARDAHRGQLLRPSPRARSRARRAFRIRPRSMRRVVGDRSPGPTMCTVSAGEGHRDFGAGEVLHAVRPGRRGGALLAADLVVVGQRPELDAIGGRAGGQFSGVRVPSETTEWQCRSALRMDTARF